MLGKGAGKKRKGRAGLVEISREGGGEGPTSEGIN